MEDIKALGPKGITFMVLCVFLIIFGVLTCVAASAFPIIVGILGIILGFEGLFSSYKRNLLGLLVFVYAGIGMTVLALILMFILLLAIRSYSIPGYVGTGGLLIVSPIAAWLAFDGRGRTLSVNPAP